MNPIRTTSEVLDAIQQAKAGASDFSTNFFLNTRKLQEWVSAKELYGEAFGRTAFFLRADRGFWHLYFSAPNREELQRALAAMPELRTEQFVVDLVGAEAAVKSWISIWESVGFRPYKKLFRMARSVEKGLALATFREPRIDFAAKADSRVLFDMICRVFDKYAEQLPTLYEIEMATESLQILTARSEGQVAGLLYFEDQCLTSMVRYWLIGEPFRNRGFGSALMRHYLARDVAVRRSVLWVIADNKDTIAKYRQHGFAPDGLFDYVFANEMIRE